VLLEMTRQSPTLASLAQRMSERFGRSFTATELDQVLRQRIPAVMFGAHADSEPRGPLHLRFRLFRREVLTPLLLLTSKLFRRNVAIVLGCLFLAVDGFVVIELWRHGLESAPQASLAGALLLTLFGVAAHELGHLSACHRFGAPYGGIGFGLYWCLPVFYAEVHGAWLLTRTERSAVDIAGIYFQSLYLLGVATLYFVAPPGAPLASTLLLALWGSHFLMLNTLNPVLKYDGYWLLSDLSGSYNLHRRMRDNARRCWAAMQRRPGAVWPEGRECLLLLVFLTLAATYFGYVLGFMAHNLAYAASRVGISQSAWHRLAAVCGLALAGAFALGVTLMLARAIGDVVSLGTTNKSGDGHGAY